MPSVGRTLRAKDRLVFRRFDRFLDKLPREEALRIILALEQDSKKRFG